MGKFQNISFSVDSFDSDGDRYERGVYIHFGDTAVRICESVDDIEYFDKKINKIISEIREL